MIRKEVSEERRENLVILHYDIFVRNVGPDAAEKVVVVDKLSGIDVRTVQNFVDPAGGRWKDQVPPELIAEIDRIEPNANVRCTFDVVINLRELPNGGELNNVASVKSATPAGPRTVDQAKTRTEVRGG